MTPNTLFVIAAGSGGHILPALTLAQQWLEKNPGGNILFFTGASELEKNIVKGKGFLAQFMHYHLYKFSLRQWWYIPVILIQFLLIFARSFFYALWHKPERVITTGGLLAIPISLAAWLARRRVELYELNVIPGKAIKALMPFAQCIYSVFAQTKRLCRWWFIDFSDRCQQTIYPIRYTNQDRTIDLKMVVERINTQLKQQDAAHLFSADRKTVFVLGGSQGSALLNKLIKGFVSEHAQIADQIQIIHQTGAYQELDWNDWYKQKKIPALTFGYDERISLYYALADVIVCRAGAGTLFEIAFFQKRCIVIPLVAPTTAHQIYNAQAMAQQYPQLFTVIDQMAVTQNPNVFYDAVLPAVG